MSNYKLVLNNELYHHGIKGQKWGVRRFQNEDGTLTSAGRKHLASNELKDAKNTYKKSINDYRTLDRNSDLYRSDPKKWQKQAIDTQKQINKNKDRLLEAKLNKELSKGKITKKAEKLAKDVAYSKLYDELQKKYDDPDKVHQMALNGSKHVEKYLKLKTSKAYDDYNKAINDFTNAEHGDIQDPRERVAKMDAALKAEKAAKKNFTREDKKQVRYDIKAANKRSKENLKRR